MAVGFSADTDDDGTGTTGTIHNAAWKAAMAAAIDALISEPTSYTPAWTATGTAPALGNGTIVGSYMKSNKKVTARIVLTAGSTTTYGTGDYRFSLPIAASSGVTLGHAQGINAGTANYDGTTAIVTSTTVAVFVSGGATIWGQLVPFTWGPGDSITIQITYQVA